LVDVPDQDMGSNASRHKVVKPPAKTVPSSDNAYTVVKGDTLFSISLRYDLDYKKLAAANNINSPYVIRPGDVIYLKESTPGNTANAAVYPVKNPVVIQTQKKTGITENKVVKENQNTSLNSVKKVSVAPAVPKPVEKTAVNSASVISHDSQWMWPVAGKVVREFSPQDALSKGIDISAEIGVPVVSAKAGEVVYAGSGLKGYGNLIIIRHDETYISAYAHNRTILVKEGQTVKQGEKVAELGMSGTQFPKLHFEIREQGKPINPLKLLPAR
jgi:lipoprotein NlpD